MGGAKHIHTMPRLPPRPKRDLWQSNDESPTVLQDVDYVSPPDHGDSFASRNTTQVSEQNSFGVAARQDGLLEETTFTTTTSETLSKASSDISDVHNDRRQLLTDKSNAVAKRRGRFARKRKPSNDLDHAANAESQNGNQLMSTSKIASVMVNKAIPRRSEFLHHSGQGTNKQRIFKYHPDTREHRPYFTGYLMLVQVIILVCSLVMYDLTPVSISSSTERGEVLTPLGSPHFIEREASFNFYIGPSPEDLVLLGAKYAPCMRYDSKIQDENRRQIQASESNHGCCFFNSNSRCFNSNPVGCSGVLTNFDNDTCWNPNCCLNPLSYPSCNWKPIASLDESIEDICSCTITARPCCHGLMGECSIVTESECAFLDGHFHNDKTLCGDVDCMQSICGLSKFKTKGVPDQWYRFVLAPFLSVGVNHLLLLLIAEMILALDVEKVIGTWRFIVIFWVGTIGGYVLSGIFTPYQVQCGSSPGLYGLAACLIVELVQSWKRINNPKRKLAKVGTLSIIAFALGLLPYIDNFAHIGGFICGGTAGIAVLPWRTMKRWSHARRQLFQVVCTSGLCIVFVIGISFFFSGEVVECSWCEKLNCVEFTKGFCENTGQSLRSNS